MSKAAPQQAAPHIVAGGGWVQVTRSYRPKATLFAVLTVLWLFPAAGAIAVLAVSPKLWWHAAGFLQFVAAIGFDEWIALSLLAAHPLFAWPAWHYYRKEPLKAVTTFEPNPGFDLKKLY
jgi:hypothetical protein